MIHKRAFLARLLAGSLLAAGLAGAAPPPPAKPASAPARSADARPNILFILIDDMGWGDLSVTGNRLVATPNMDRLAREGLLLTQFYDAAPICSASRAGFMTGRFPAEVHFTTFLAFRKRNAAAGQADWLDPKLPFLARTLHDAGYATGHFGKWHLGGGRDVGDAPLPSAYGFDESYVQFEGLGPRVLPNDESIALSRQSKALGHGPIDELLKSALTGRFIDKTLDFVRRHKGQRWFADLWPDDVHSEWVPSAADLAAVQGKGRNERETRFLAVLVAMDREIGRLIEGLRAAGELDNTLIVFTSDNGPTAGAAAPGSAGPFRGRKGSLYEGGIRQPMILRWPGHLAAGRRDDATVAHAVDLFPTLAAVAGAKSPPGGEGIDLWPAIRGQRATSRPDLFFTFGAKGPDRSEPVNRGHDRSPAFAIRSGKWKLLQDQEGTPVELYDLSADPGETRDVAAAQAGVAKQLGARLDRWRKPLGLAPSPAEGIRPPASGGNE